MNLQNILILPGYYYLYALYADYRLANTFFNGKDDTRRLREIVRVVQEIKEVMEPFRKSWALRLFTERGNLARFSPELVNEVLRELRAMAELLGPPPGWEESEEPNRARMRHRRPRKKKPTTPLKRLTRLPERPVVLQQPPAVPPPLRPDLMA